MPLTAGTRLGPYEIQAAIGAGGMGEVYKARDTRLDRLVAIKVLPAHVAADPQLRDRFEREARAVAALNHPHICTLHDVGQQDGINFLVMEYLDGQTLAQRLEKGALPLDQALEYAIQIADALDKAHRHGITHRDLKPGNVMLTKSGTKLLDFGLAKLNALPAGALAGLSALPTQQGLTVQGTILGTLQYMAPEQLEGKDADARTDIFAFGAVCYEMVTGKKAFDGKTQASLIAAILEHDPPSIAATQPLTPPAFDRVVKKCLAKEPERRWQSAGDLTDELKWIAEGAAVSTPAPIASRARSRERIAWALGAIAALTIGVLAIPATLYLRRAVPEPVVTRLDVVTPPTSDAFSFALSPDGRQLAFVANGEKASQLWLRPLDQVTAQPLAGTEGASFPFWAPDGRAIGFFADGKLKRIGLTGGALQELADAPYPRGGTWNADGVIVFAPSIADALMRVAATGGSVAPVTRLAAGQGSHRWPQSLPDGRRFLFLMATGQPETQGVYVGSLDGGEPIRVMPAETAAVYAAPGYLLLVSQRVLVAYPFDVAQATVVGEPTPVAQAVGTDDGAFHSAFSVSAEGVLAHRAGAGAKGQLIWVDRTGKMLGGIGQADENAPANPELAPDGQRVGISRVVQGNIDVWLIEVGRGVPSRFTFDVAVENAPIWSPDGSKVVFRSTRKGVHDLFEKPASGTADEQPLLVTSQGKGPLDWSRDGRFLLYSTQDPKTGSDLWALPLTGERKPPSFGPSSAVPNSGEPRRSLGGGGPFAVLDSSFEEIAGQFSPDGRLLAYASNESGRYEIYVRTFPEAGGKWQVSVSGGVQPRWRRDGRELFYVAPDRRLMAVPIRLAPNTQALDTGPPVPLFSTRLATGANIAPAGFLARAQYAVAPDGRFLMNVAADEAVTSPITIVQNWTAALTK
ncbi:MAG: protein kinase domain-containing protein [Vicinamibacterales bacterium]